MKRRKNQKGIKERKEQVMNLRNKIGEEILKKMSE
jgi:hypothetical protein